MVCFPRFAVFPKVVCVLQEVIKIVIHRFFHSFIHVSSITIIDKYTTRCSVGNYACLSQYVVGNLACLIPSVRSAE